VGFLLAGGGALAAQRLTTRPTRDLDSGTFCRIVVSGPEDLLVDLALDSAPSRPSTASIAGPTFGLEELAGRKVIALFDRAEARDFADVFVLAQRYDKNRLLAWAAEVDSGFSLAVFADMTGAVSRFGDDELPVDREDVSPLREFFAAWAAELRTSDL
jgi:hypothetical protein